MQSPGTGPTAFLLTSNDPAAAALCWPLQRKARQMSAEISNLIYLTIVNLDPDTGGITDIVNIPVTEVDVVQGVF